MSASIDSVDFSHIEPRLSGATLLLGNGFSIACDPRYSYRALRGNVEESLPAVSRDLLDRLHTDNLEEVLQIVEDARWVADQFSQPEFDHQLREAHRETSDSLVRALAEDHLKSPSDIDRDRERSPHAVRFLDLFDRIFTTNYDLLLYWTMMKDIGREQDGYKYRDGFKREEGEDFGQFDLATDPNVFYLHGALHLYSHDREARKHLRLGDRGLVATVRATIEEGDLPLFVAGGRPEQKLETIRRSPYLTTCFEKFSELSGQLVIYGLSLGASDQHLLDAMAANPDLEEVYLSYYGDLEASANLRLRATAADLQSRAAEQRRRPLAITLFPSPSAGVWG